MANGNQVQLFDPNALKLDPARFPGVDPGIVGRAQNIIGAKYTPQAGQLGRTMDILGEQQATDIDKLTQFGDYGQRAIGGITQQLTDQLQANVGEMQSIYSDGVNLVQQPYQMAGQTMSDILGQLGQYIQGIENQLGTGNLFGSAMAPVQAGAIGEIGRFQELGAGRAANLAELGTGMTGLAQQGVSFAQQAGAQRQEDFLDSIAGAIAETQRDFGLQRFEVLGQAADLMQQLGFDVANTMDELIERADEKAYQREQDKFSRDMQLGELGIGPYAGHFRAREERMAKPVDPLDQLSKILTVSGKLGDLGYDPADLGLEDLGLLSDISPQEPEKYSGRGGLQRWLDDTGAPLEYSQAAEKIVEQAVAAAAGDTGQAYNLAYMNIQDLLAKQAIGGSIMMSVPGASGRGANVLVPADWLLEAVDVYFGKY